MPNKTLTVIAGPNGSGKTTFSYIHYPDLIDKGVFLNADLIAQEINPEDVNAIALLAGKKFLTELDQRIHQGSPILIETTLSGRSLLHKMSTAKQQGFRVKLIFLWIETADLCDFRVKLRVSLGGHNIPLDVIERRHARGLNNLQSYLKTVDEYEIFQANGNPILIAHKNLNLPVTIIDKSLYNEFMSITS
jgi:predicted ABC-type ATPase